MTDPRTPDETRMRRVYRPAPTSRPSRQEERALSEQFLAASEEFDESVLLSELEPADRDLVERRVHEETLAGIVALRWVNLAIVLLLAALDLLRWREGAFDLRWPDAYINLATVGAHLLIAIAVLVSFRIADLRRYDPTAQVRGAALVHMGLVCVALLVIALAALVLRDSTFGFAIAVLMGNLVYHLPRSGRVAFNLSAALIALAAILNGAGASPAGNLLRFAEVTTALVLTVLAGNLVRRQRVRAVIVELRLSSMALVDGLTGVASRRRVEEIAEGELAMSAPDRPLSIILLDLDDFKLVNDTHGHNAGDEVLRGIARLLQQRGRLNDTVGRWGGEEFLMVLPDTPATGALELAEALRGRISRQLFEGIGSCTASFGVAESRAGDTLMDLIARADGALYDAKRAGRNRVREAIPPELTARQGGAASVTPSSAPAGPSAAPSGAA